MSLIYSIYIFTNKVNNKKYVGFSKDPTSRLYSHKKALEKGTKNKLYRSMRIHGWDKFEFSIIYQSKDLDHCKNVMEGFFINEFDSYKNGYNMTLGGEGVTNQEVYWTPERKKIYGQKMSLHLKGKPKSSEHIENMKGARPHVDQTGGKNNNARPITTPFGKFDSMVNAFQVLSKENPSWTYRKIHYNLNSNKPGWSYGI